MGLFRSRRRAARGLRADTSEPMVDKEFTDQLARVASTSQPSEAWPTGTTQRRRGVRAAVIAVATCSALVVAAVGVTWASGVARPPWAPDESPSPIESPSPSVTTTEETDGPSDSPSPSTSSAPTDATVTPSGSAPSSLPTSPRSTGPSRSGTSAPTGPSVSGSLSVSVSANPANRTGKLGRRTDLDGGR